MNACSGAALQRTARELMQARTEAPQSQALIRVRIQIQIGLLMVYYYRSTKVQKYQPYKRHKEERLQNDENITLLLSQNEENFTLRISIH